MKTFFQSVLKHIDKLDAAKLREQYRLVTEEVAFFEMVFNAMNEARFSTISKATRSTAIRRRKRFRKSKSPSVKPPKTK